MRYSGPESGIELDSAGIIKARWLLEHAASHDTGKPLPFRLDKSPLDNKQTHFLSSTAFNGLLSVAYRVEEIGLDPNQNAELLAFAEELKAFHEPETANALSTVGATDKPKWVGRLALSFGLIKP